LASHRGQAFQHTLARSVCVEGVGIHSGLRVRLELHPGAPGSGWRFLRRDVADRDPWVRASAEAVVETRLSTVLANADGVRVATVEHLAAALAALGVDNVLVALDGPELPILDGSASEWVALIDAAGLAVQAAPRRRFVLRRPLRIRLGESSAILIPAEHPRYSVSIEFPERLIGHQHLDFELDAEVFRRDIAPARTFGFLRDIERLLAEGLARGGSLDNAVVVDGERVLNPGGLRFPDEFVRHKLLDLIGDLALIGAPIMAHVIAHRPGHALNNRILRALVAEDLLVEQSLAPNPAALAARREPMARRRQRRPSLLLPSLAPS
jgi:UDP-3-O-[3-hydroxymyristoyl] N-acetylglucosamine deacetylase